MRTATKWILVLAACVTSVVLLGGAVWYRSDRAHMLGALCRAGLPNFSRPSVIRSEHLGCAILTPRKKVSGVLVGGFEASGLIESDLPPAPKNRVGSPGGTWWTCNQTKGCGDLLDKALSRPIPGLCGMRLAHVVAYGWATETAGRYGHMGDATREFYEDEVIETGPPPARLVARLRRQRIDIGLADCG